MTTPHVGNLFREGRLADATSITYVYKVCSFLPLIGVLTVFLPNIESKRAKA